MDYTKKLTFEEKLARARVRRGTADEQPAQKETPPEPARLPLCPEAVRAVPNGFLRSALFGAIAKGRRRYINGEELAAVDGVTIRYKGERLDQGDLDVWASILHAVRAQTLGSQCRLKSYGLLQMMGKTDSGKNRDTLQTRIERLVANALTVKQGRYTYIGSLIRFAAKDEETQEWVIELDEKLCLLFAEDQFTQLDWEIRRALNGQQLAQWLHGFYASHAQPYPIKVETLLKLSGGENADPYSGKQKLRKALEAVTEASTAHGQPFSYQILGDLVSTEKKAIGTQQRHLAKKAAAKKAASRPRKPRA